jgi:acylphosphatase
MAKVRAHVVISGLVQGVFFRDSTRRVASGHHVTGWVRNLPDGRVEAVFEGEEEDVRRVVEWCHQGPSHAAVEDVAVEWGVYTGQFERFAVR